MALLLYRIGRLSYRHRWPVLVAWITLLGIALAAGLGFGGTMKESFAIPGTESQRALDRLEQVFPEVAGASAQVVLEAETGTIADRRAEIAEAVERLGEVDHVIQALDPFSEYATGTLADDGRAAIVQVQFDSDDMGLIRPDAERVQEIADGLEQHGLRVEYGGQLYQNIEYGLTVTEVIGVAFAAVVLIVAFGSVLAAGMPLLSAIVAVGSTMGVLLVIARFAIVSSATPLLAVMIGLAVGIDYALFILSRHRNQLAHGADPEESAATAVGTSGSAVVFAGATVMVALLGLVIVGIPFLSVMGIAAAGGVLMALLTSVTLLPALLGFAGERLRPKEGSRAWRRETGANPRPTMGRRWVRLVLRAPIVVVLLVVAVLGAIAVPALHMQTSLPSGKGEAAGNTARDAYDILTEHFGEGANGPMLVMLDITQMSNDTLMDDLAAIGDLVAAAPGVELAGDALPNPTVDSAIIQVIPTTGPDDPATMDTVAALRDLAPTIEEEYGAVSSVTGATAVQIDITNRLNGALLPFAGVVVGLSFVLLMLVFRSVLVPAKAAVSFLLSAFAAFGVVVLVFQDGVLGPILGIVPGPIIAFLPVLLLAIVFGLAMDYEVFLVSGMREAHVRGAPAREAIEEGFANAARVVTAAALIMFFVFFAFVPEGAGVIKVIALGLAAGIAFDAFLVRMTLVPALMALFGERAWRLPRWLDRMLPDLDIEGEGLREYQEQAAWAAEHRAAIALDGLRVGDDARRSSPIAADVPAGGALVARGDAGARRVLAATLQGRLAPAAGRAQVLGRSLPGDAPGLVSRVARVDLADLDDRRRELGLGQLLGRHASFGTAMLRMEAPAAEVERLLDRLSAALGPDAPRLGAGTRLDRLHPVDRAIALVAIALAERPEALVLDLGALAAAPDAPRIAARILAAARELADEPVAIVLGAPDGFDADRLRELVDGPLEVVDLGALRTGDARDADAAGGAAARAERVPALAGAPAGAGAPGATGASGASGTSGASGASDATAASSAASSTASRPAHAAAPRPASGPRRDGWDASPLDGARPQRAPLPPHPRFPAPGDPDPATATDAPSTRKDARS
ncbi:MAG: MMPL family transporter [Microbacteriaceae bacterium]|nr:MMPL family transporter [Microbacteriaceae bacterium]